MTVTREQRRQEVEQFIRASIWEEVVPDVPDTHVGDWGTLGWARYCLALLAELEQAEKDRDDLRHLIDSADFYPDAASAELAALRAEARLAKVPALVEELEQAKRLVEWVSDGRYDYESALAQLSVWEAENSEASSR